MIGNLFECFLANGKWLEFNTFIVHKIIKKVARREYENFKVYLIEFDEKMKNYGITTRKSK